MELRNEIYKWLADTGVVSESEIASHNKNSVVVNAECAKLFEIGLKFPTLLYRLYQLMVTTLIQIETFQAIKFAADLPLPELDSLRYSEEPEDKCYNWGIIAECLEAHSIKVEPEEIEAIIEGDLTIVLGMLDKLKKKEYELNTKEPHAEIFEEESPQIQQQSQQSVFLLAMRYRVRSIYQRWIQKRIRVKPAAALSFYWLYCVRRLNLHLSGQDMEIVIKQAAGFLADSNKYLSYALVKGMKGDYQPSLNWLYLIKTYSSHFARLIRIEERTGSVSMALGTIKGGLYSKSDKVAEASLYVLESLCGNLKGLSEQVWDWLKQEGFDAITNILLTKEKRFIKKVVEVFGRIGKGRLATIFIEILPKGIGGNHWEYILEVTEFCKKHKRNMKLYEDLPQIIQYSGKECVQRGKDLHMFLLDLWINFRKIVEEKAELAETILGSFKKGLHDTNVAMQIFTTALLFRLLGKFAKRRKPYAPVLYRILASYLVENVDSEVRYFVIENFKLFYGKYKNVPLLILLKPYAMQVQMKQGIINLFDFGFIENLASYPKMDLSSATHILDICTDIVLKDYLYGPLAVRICLPIWYQIRENPFTVDYMRRIAREVLGTIQNLIKRQTEKTTTKVIHSRVFRFQSSQAYTESIDVRAHIKVLISFLSDIQLVSNNDGFLDELHESVLATHNSIKKLIRTNYKPLYSLLEGKGDPEALIKTYEELILKSACEYTESNTRIGSELELYRPHKIEQSSALPTPIRASTRLKNFQELSGALDRSSAISMDRTNCRRDKSETPSRSRKYMLVPYYIHYADEDVSRKAIIELEKIKKKRFEREIHSEQRKIVSEIKERKRKKALRFQLERRKLELGVMPRVSFLTIQKYQNKQSEVSIIYPYGSLRESPQKSQSLFHPPNIKLVDLIEEEERECIAVQILVERYKKVLRYLFKAYANTCYVTHKPRFEDLRKKYSLITLGEVNKMFKEHLVPESLLSKDEVATIARLINMKEKRNDMLTLSYEGFKEFMAQAAFYIYRKDGSDVSLAECVKKMIKDFGNAEVQRHSTSAILYINPDATSLGDPDLLKELNKIIQENPLHPLPEGYSIKEVKDINYVHTISTSLPLPEPLKIGIEILDSVINSIFPQTHFLESIAITQGSLRVAPKIVKPEKHSIPTRFMDPLINPLCQHNQTAPPSHKELPQKPKRKLPPPIKMAIALLPKDMQSIGYEVGETLDDILTAVEQNKDTIEKPERKMNWGMKEKLRWTEELNAYQSLKEQKRINRHKFLKKLIHETKTSKSMMSQSNDVEIEEYRRISREQEAKIRKEREEIRKKLVEAKQKRKEEEQKAQQEEFLLRKKEEEQKSKFREAFLKKRKEEIVNIQGLNYRIKRQNKQRKQGRRQWRTSQTCLAAKKSGSRKFCIGSITSSSRKMQHVSKCINTKLIGRMQFPLYFTETHSS
eukprot:TRINITY_DN105787_c0_g1_i1.p1 TRINITY_DN105787_c0_g1~~TRINITY_DN105787_c0_g1_i1.p1  ORF type:complete len:1468 (-),score=154.44 TRINITY_DN105787_c0_g1_i1:7053-11372(-)